MASESKGFSGTQLEYSYAFGLKGDVTKNVEYLDDNVVVYPCGHSLVHFNTETRAQQFVPGSPNSHGITAMATTQSKRCVAAKPLLHSDAVHLCVVTVACALRVCIRVCALRVAGSRRMQRAGRGQV